ncbi:MAG: cobalamin-binding protein [Desulfarculaceae bacterium]|nr:cobalamin-binding protein [Desulfarculaceae bacterium]
MRARKSIALVLALTAALALLAARPVLAKGSLETDEMGRQVVVPSHPQRLIGLIPSLTEVFFALGLGDKVVGATTWADYPPAARRLPRVGAYVSPNLEQIVALKPDLVVANKEGNPPWVVHRLSGMGVPVYVTVPVAPEELPASLAKLGAVLGAPEAGNKLAAELKAQFAEVARRLKGVKPRPTLLVIGSRPLVSAGRDTMNHRLLELAGGINVASASSQRWPRLNLEFVVDAKPEVIIVSTMERGQNLGRELEYWRKLPGVGDRPGVRVGSIQSDIIDRPGPRLGLGLMKLAALIHPERFAPEKAQ